VKQPTTAAFFELASPLFLLFLQEIISDRDRLRRRNPGIPAGSWARNSGPVRSKSMQIDVNRQKPILRGRR
jgi:hypothetical protein